MPALRGRGHLIGPAFTLGSMTSVQLGAALAVPVMKAHGALGITALRLAVAALVLVVLIRPRLGRFERRQWQGALALGLAMAWMTVAFFEAATRLPLGAATTLDYLGPLAVSIVALRGWARAVLPLLALGGVLAIAYGPDGWLLDPAGMLIALCAAAGWAAYIVLMRQVGRLFSGQEGLCLSLATAALIALPTAAIVVPGALSLREVPVAAGLALLVPLIPYSLEMMALRRMNVGAFSIMMSLEPAIGAALGFAILGQRLSLQQVAGTIAVMTASLGAVYLTSRSVVLERAEPASLPERCQPSAL